MEIAFDTKHLRKICESESIAKKEIGKEETEILKHRLADLQAAISIEDLIVGNIQKIKINGKEGIAINLKNKNILLTANHFKIPRSENGVIMWEKVWRIKIVGIE